MLKEGDKNALALPTFQFGSSDAPSRLCWGTCDQMNHVVGTGRKHNEAPSQGYSAYGWATFAKNQAFSTSCVKSGSLPCLVFSSCELRTFSDSATRGPPS